MAMPIKTTERMSATQFLDLPETNLHRELLEGEVIVAASPVNAHQRAVGRIYRLLLSLIPDGEVILSPSDVHLDEWNVVQPDVFWIAQDSACLDVETHFVGAPTLIVEVLSPSAATQDKVRKFRLYERHSISEYWLVDIDGGYVEAWRNEAEKFVFIGRYTTDEIFISPTLGTKSVTVSDILVS